jgi:hypothetical protein
MLDPQNIVYSKLNRIGPQQSIIKLRQQQPGTTPNKPSKVTMQTPKLAFWDYDQTQGLLELAFIHDETSNNEQALGLFRTLLLELDDKFRHDHCLSKLRETYKYHPILQRKQRGLFPVTTICLRSPKQGFSIYDEAKQEITQDDFQALARKGTRFIALIGLDRLEFTKTPPHFGAVLNILQLQVFSENQTLISYAFKDVEVIEDADEELLVWNSDNDDQPSQQDSDEDEPEQQDSDDDEDEPEQQDSDDDEEQPSQQDADAPQKTKQKAKPKKTPKKPKNKNKSDS